MASLVISCILITGGHVLRDRPWQGGRHVNGCQVRYAAFGLGDLSEREYPRLQNPAELRSAGGRRV